ncbi:MULTISPECIES: helix-turn-helix domain-containing protein [Cupriavidus]|jgi:antitoxin component HigA of HigAB toxin-antitoxin module|uniref:helix-turn-helix domain-containing protein n=2 Tax=unclassified Cupriavidus TaxID=2640874 RepID=UPI0021011A11|nr:MULTISPECIES: helix-turn-helix domain-containing protein [unclassified Cupriavidus]
MTHVHEVDLSRQARRALKAMPRNVATQIRSKIDMLAGNPSQSARGRLSMTDIQFIEQDGQRAFAVVPIDVWDKVKHLFEDLDDVALYDRAKAADDGVRIPAAVVDAELAGDHPVKAWRDYRRMTQEALAQAAGLSTPYLSQIENRKRDGTVDVLQRLALALGVPMDLLVDDAD